jgi:Arc/MetJ family transcription regulator
MRTTLNIEDNLMDKASKMTGIKEKTALVKLGLEALIARESAMRLAKLGGTQKQLKAVPSLPTCLIMEKFCAIHLLYASLPVVILRTEQSSFHTWNCYP